MIPLYLTTKNQLRGLSKNDYEILRLLCRLSKNLYNEALYSVRQYYFTEKKYLRYEDNYHYCKSSDNYKLLNTDIAQQTMKAVDRSFKSFFGLLALAKQGLYPFEDISIPHYRPKDGYFSLLIPRAKIKNGAFAIPVSLEFKKRYGTVTIHVPEMLWDKPIKEIRIHPKCNGRFFEIEYVYEKPEVSVPLNPGKFLSVDLGLDNLASCVTDDGASFIIDGKQIKSYNRLYNKENARLQSVKDRQGIKGNTKRQYLNLRKRNRRIRHGMSVAASRIIRFCIDNEIGNLVVGCNPEWKQGINIGKQNNQNFVQIPHGTLRTKLSYLCQLYGIRYIEQEESYTSKASFFDNDPIPVYDPENPTNHTFSGKRISRGQYRSKNGIVINADINGALNILRKCNLIDLTVLQNSGCVSQPQRIRLF